jgi:hypothetical protein
MDGLSNLSVPGYATRSPRPLTCFDSNRNVSYYIRIINSIIIIRVMDTLSDPLGGTTVRQVSSVWCRHNSQYSGIDQVRSDEDDGSSVYWYGYVMYLNLLVSRVQRAQIITNIKIITKVDITKVLGSNYPSRQSIYR